MHIIKTVDVIMRFRLSVDSSLVNFWFMHQIWRFAG